MSRPDIHHPSDPSDEPHGRLREMLRAAADKATGWLFLIGLTQSAHSMSSPIARERDEQPEKVEEAPHLVGIDLTEKIRAALQKALQEDVYRGYKWAQLLQQVTLFPGEKGAQAEIEAVFQLSASKKMVAEELGVVARRIIESQHFYLLLTELSTKQTQVTIVFSEPFVKNAIKAHIDAQTGKSIELKTDIAAQAAMAAIHSLRYQTKEVENQGKIPPVAQEAADFSVQFGKLKSRYYWSMWRAKLQPLLRTENPITVKTIKAMCTPEVREAWEALKKAWLNELDTMLESRWANYLPVIEHISTVCEELQFAYEHLSLPVKDTSKAIMTKVREYDASIEMLAQTNQPKYPLLVAQLNKERGVAERNYWQLLHRYAYMQVGNEKGE